MNVKVAMLVLGVALFVSSLYKLCRIIVHNVDK